MAADSYAAWLREELGGLVDELELDDRQKRFMRSRWLDQVVWLEGKAKTSQQRYYALRMVAIVGGLIVPALVSLNVRGSDVRRGDRVDDLRGQPARRGGGRDRGVLPLRRALAPLPPHL